MAASGHGDVEALGADSWAGRRIVIYGMNYAPEFTGVGRYTGEIGAHFAAIGADVTVITTPPHYPGWQVRDGYRNRYSVERRDRETIFRCPLLLRKQMRGLWRFAAPMSFALSSAPVAFWQILRRRPSVVLCVEPTLASAPAALLAARLVSARLVLHVQDLEVDAAFEVGHLGPVSALRGLATAIERLILKRFDGLVTISRAMRDRIVAKGVSPDRISLVRNWVDLDRIRPLQGVSPYRSELGIPEHAFVVQYAGNIGRKQGLHLLVEAAARLSEQRDIVFVIAGEGPEKSELEARAKDLPNVRFLGFQPEERMADFLGLSDLHALPQEAGAADLVLPSKLGGMLGSGRPILVTAGAGTEIVTFLADAAIIAPPGDVDALAAAILREAESREQASEGAQRKRLGLAARLERGRALSAFGGACLEEPATGPVAELPTSSLAHDAADGSR